MLSWNVQGLYNKLSDNSFRTFLCDFDIVCVLETWLRKELLDTVNLAGFAAFHTCRDRVARKGRYAGGVTVFIRQALTKGVTLLSTDLSDSIFLKLDCNVFGMSKNIIIGSIYIPPSGSTCYVSEENGIELLE